jgi:hypothetical protein
MIILGILAAIASVASFTIAYLEWSSAEKCLSPLVIYLFGDGFSNAITSLRFFITARIYIATLHPYNYQKKLEAIFCLTVWNL